MSKKIKLAMLRKEPEDKCPFGLKITLACKNVGNLIDNMTPIENLNQKENQQLYSEIVQNNNYLFRWHASKERCPYANKILAEETQTVECNFNQPDAKFNIDPINPPQSYIKNFQETGLHNMKTYPISYYEDYNLDRGNFFGLFNLNTFASKKGINNQ